MDPASPERITAARSGRVDPRPSATPGWPRAPRSLNAGRGAAWWSEGWRIFIASPSSGWASPCRSSSSRSCSTSSRSSAASRRHCSGRCSPAACCSAATRWRRGGPIEFRTCSRASGRAARTAVILGVFAFAVSLAFAMVIMMLVFGAMGFSAGQAHDGRPDCRHRQRVRRHGDCAALIAVPIALVAYGLFLMAWWFAPALVGAGPRGRRSLH